MLLIGDVHLSVKMKARILDKLRHYVLDSPDKNVIFLGDYLPGFVYDRQVMAEFYDLLLEFACH
jgi:hypothetical protein